MIAIEDCYTILGVEETSSASEIKHAFRQKAKKHHPDVTGKKNDADSMTLLLQAYKCLTEHLAQDDNRHAFEQAFRSYRAARAEESFDFRTWLSSRSDYQSRARLIFFDLLHDREEDAVSEYHLRRDGDCSFTLEAFFDREDFMDCGFILAEELTFFGDYYESFLLLLRIMQLEKEKPYFRHFYPEVEIMMRDILRNRLPGSIGDDLLIDCYEDALEADLNLEKKDEAVCFRRMAEAFERLGDKKAAAACFRESVKLDPAGNGLVSLEKKLRNYL